MVFSNNLLMGAAGQASGYEIEQSIRFNDDDAAYLYRDVDSAPTNGKKFTYSVWIKRGAITGGTNNGLLSGGSGTSTGRCDFTFTAGSASGDSSNNDALKFDIFSGSFDQTRATAKLRDPSSWYHIVLVFDAENGTANNTLIIYLNGNRLELDSTSGVPDVAALVNANGQRTRVGADASNTPVEFDGYMAEINMIDGQALAPTALGKTNDDGVWIPKAYSGTYGDNGFYITGATDSDLGEDFSGNNNDFTSTGLTTADQRLDTPTLNASTLNPLWKTAATVLSDGNLVAKNASGNTYQRVISTFAIDDGGKYACEFQKSAGTFGYVGIFQVGNNNVTSGNNYMYAINVGTGEVVKNSSVLVDVGAAPANSLMRIEYDGSNDTIKIFDDGTEIFPASTGVSNVTGLTGQNSLHFGCAMFGSGTIITATFQGLSGTPTADFLELTSANLATPTVKDGSAHFQPTLYTGTSSALEVDQSGNSTFTPSFAWIKSRSSSSNHVLIDAVRGVSKQLYGNAAAAEATATDGLTSFDADGFTLGDDSGDYVNIASANMIGYQWKANGGGSSNTDGTITSSASVSQEGGFSILTYTGIASSTGTVGHGLGAVPAMILFKNLPGSTTWYVYHKDIPNPNQTVLHLDTTAAATNVGVNTFNNTSPTSSVFSLGNDTNVNANGESHVAYCFAEIPGYSSIGVYEGNGNADGSFVYTGFKPAFILTKNIDTADQWGIRDAARNPFNVTDLLLNPNAATAETNSTTGYIDILSNGFKARSSDTNINSSTIVYMAFAENPFGGDGVAPATAR